LKNSETGIETQVKSDLIFACDGAFSAVRYKSMQKLDKFNYEQRFIEDGYRELLLPANKDGSYKLDKNALHIWPRGRFMLIALANENGSFTCTLFMPSKGENSFEALTSKEKVNTFFKETFPDFYEMMPSVGAAWGDHPLSSLAIIRCYPWTSGKVALMGDAAHATVPFYGQGMNCAFEDCIEIDACLEEFGDWDVAMKHYEKRRKPNADAIADLALQNFIEMRDLVGDESFLHYKKIEHDLCDLHPDVFQSQYEMVSFSTIPYKEALDKGAANTKRIYDLIAEGKEEKITDKAFVQEWFG
jgi:kynurenine 3-monooxygenase